MKPVTTITKNPPGVYKQMKEVYTYKNLIILLALRDIKAKYANTVLGITWVLINPLINLCIIILVFNYIAGINPLGHSYPFFAGLALIIWSYFSEVLSNSADSLLNAQELIKKIYFPRLTIPLSRLIIPCFDVFSATLVVILTLVLEPVALNIRFFPLLMVTIEMVLISMTTAIWISALVIRFRDFKYIIPLLSRILFFLTPIGYSLDQVPIEYKFLFYFNPIAGIIEWFRWCFLDVNMPDLKWGITFLAIPVLLFLGVTYFNKVEHTIADNI